MIPRSTRDVVQRLEQSERLRASLRRAIGTLGHNRHFSGAEVAEYLGGQVSTSKARSELTKLVKSGYLGLDEEGFFVKALGWNWIEGA